jgi:RimJ/RimL family protein N-acetyltransferase
MLVPESVRTARLLLRPWAAGDAGRLLPILEANLAHLGPWIPPRVFTPAPLPELAARLAGFAADFAAAREWRYALLTPDAATVLGEVALFARTADARVAFDAADRVEVGYWLRADCTGRGYATEAAEAALAVARSLPGLGQVEIRCDARNAPSAAVPRRLGFGLAATRQQPAATPGEPPVTLQIWTYALGGSTVAGA